VRRLLVTANVVPSSPIPVTLMMEEQSSSETSILTITTWRKFSEDAILQKEGANTLWTLYFKDQAISHCDVTFEILNSSK
jgi:hypothetical protein